MPTTTSFSIDNFLFQEQIDNSQRGKKNKKDKKVKNTFSMGPRSYEEINTDNLAKEERINEAKKKMEEKRKPEDLKKTRMCMNLGCTFGDNCHYAHHIDELQILDCAYGDDCKHVIVSGGKVTNAIGKTCTYLHPSETFEACKIRTGVASRVTKSPKVQLNEHNNEPPKVQNTQPIVPPPPPVTNVPVVPPPPTLVNMPPPPMPKLFPVLPIMVQVPPPPLVLQVPKEMAFQALEMALKAGNKSVRIEIIDL
jgi:hypothetical protein